MTDESRTMRWSLHRVLLTIWLGLCIVVIFVLVFPVSYCILRFFIAVAIPTLWLGALFFLRKQKWQFIMILAPGLIVIAFMFLPGRKVETERLRELYVSHLRRYNGSRYIWGGENRIGIDCSGLVRRGLINAYVELGIRTFNPKPVRQALLIWWYDCSARALRDEYRGLTTILFAADSINSINNPIIMPGDIAVTKDGVHVLAYLGNSQWIEADPGLKRVVEITVPADNGWFKTPVQVLRWSQMQTKHKNISSKIVLFSPLRKQRLKTNNLTINRFLGYAMFFENTKRLYENPSQNVPKISLYPLKDIE